jgi:hypothetical protein
MSMDFIDIKAASVPERKCFLPFHAGGSQGKPISPGDDREDSFIPGANELGFSLNEIAHLLTLGADRETSCVDV